MTKDDLLDFGIMADEFGDILKYVDRYLARAEFDDLINKADAMGIALRTLKHTQDDLAGLIRDLETLPVEG